MNTSRREIIKAFGAGATAMVVAGQSTTSLSQGASASQPDFGSASAAEGELKIVNFDLLEEEVKKILPPGSWST